MTRDPRRKNHTYGFVEWFRPGEHERTARALDGMKRAGARYLRTHLSWAEYHAPGGRDWYDWLLPQIGSRFDLLPCVHYTPPSISRTGNSAGAPHRLQDYADFIDHVLDRYGGNFETIELWNEPNNLLDWDWREDADWQLFCEMVGAAAHWARRRGFRTVLGGPSPFDAHWLRLMGERGVLGEMSAVGLHGFPGTWDSDVGTWNGWESLAGTMRGILQEFAPDAEIWITEAGYSTWRHDEAAQVQAFLDALAAPADRLYWYGWQDIADDVAVQEGLRFDDRHYHMGVRTADGRPKLLGRLLEKGGVEAAEGVMDLTRPHVARDAAPVVVAGGAGFVGCNLAASYLQDGRDVVVLDNLSRPGVETNLAWLDERFGGRVHWAPGDVRDEALLRDVVKDAAAVFHMAAQTAVTTSLVSPVDDFEVNARGTLNLLEGDPPLGPQDAGRLRLDQQGLRQPRRPCDGRPSATATCPRIPRIAGHGIGEDRSLDFCTPYGCSKGVADQYVLDYAKSFGLPSAVLRMSCIYGPRQFGTEDQGWVAHFLIRALRGETITIYGDGKQVRDVLHVADAVAAYRAVLVRNRQGRRQGVQPRRRARQRSQPEARARRDRTAGRREGRGRLRRYPPGRPAVLRRRHAADRRIARMACRDRLAGRPARPPRLARRAPWRRRPTRAPDGRRATPAEALGMRAAADPDATHEPAAPAPLRLAAAPCADDDRRRRRRLALRAGPVARPQRRGIEVVLLCLGPRPSSDQAGKPRACPSTRLVTLDAAARLAGRRSWRSRGRSGRDRRGRRAARHRPRPPQRAVAGGGHDHRSSGRRGLAFLRRHLVGGDARRAAAGRLALAVRPQPRRP